MAMVGHGWPRRTHVPVARGAPYARGTVRKGHGGGVAYFTSTEYLIFLENLFPQIAY